jgi:hypothetical protein
MRMENLLKRVLFSVLSRDLPFTNRNLKETKA